ncbi:hypothetical protein RJ639_029291 [Escallonia herrerae]|uniref:PLD phosphodiesterase domain-containing protein n=1 Tax=Escallonia herrerae TaxID=1293975 RepID=A0AA88X4L7_9ASTE|nr:hypothetical protein RJ639_029291 [Escallonia herrerae]
MAQYWQLIANSSDPRSGDYGYSEADMQNFGANKWFGVYKAIENAADHNVRFLQHSGVYPDFTEEPSDLASGRLNVKSVTLPLSKWWGSGIIHAKVWISDSQDVYIGSANNDWKSLTQSFLKLFPMVKTAMTGSCRSLNSSEATSLTLGGTLRPTMAHGGDHLSQLSFQLTSHKLTGKNYLKWAQSVKLAIDGRGKLGHLTRDVRLPAAADPSLSVWRSENSLIIALLINSMEPTIGKPYLFLPTTKDVWEAVRETYSDDENSSQIFDLKTKLWKSKQGEREEMVSGRMIGSARASGGLYFIEDGTNSGNTCSKRKQIQRNGIDALQYCQDSIPQTIQNAIEASGDTYTEPIHLSLRSSESSQSESSMSNLHKPIAHHKVYVDDIILTRDDTAERERLKQCLAFEFEIKDMGLLKFFLGMEIARSKKGIAVSQRKYVLDLLKAEPNLLLLFCSTFEENCLDIFQRQEDRESPGSVQHIIRFLLLVDQYAVQKGETWPLEHVMGPMLAKSFQLIKTLDSPDTVDIDADTWLNTNGPGNFVLCMVVLSSSGKKPTGSFLCYYV